MKPEKPIDRLRSLRKEIAALCIVKCHMSYERIKRVGEFRLPVVSRLPGGDYERVGLCSPEARARRLGCSHTTARVKLQEAVNELSIGHGNNDGQVLESAARLNWLDNEIHLLDHRRSEAEKRLAKIEERKYRFSDPEDKSDEMPGAKELVMEMERLHDNYEEQMGELKDRVLNSLDNPIRQIEINRSAGVTEQ